MIRKINKRFLVVIASGLLVIAGIVFSAIFYIQGKTHHPVSTEDSFLDKRANKDCCKNISLVGLADLNAHGSGFISYDELKNKFQNEKSKIYVVSLLKDDIYYYNGLCLRWYGMGYMKDDLGNEIFTKKSFTKVIRRFIYGTPPIQDLSQIQTEREIVQSLGGEYYLPMKGNENWIGNMNFVDDMIRFFESVTEKDQLYIHCAHGRGRTTTFLVLYDIFRNGKNVPLKDITQRQYCLGRENVLNTVLWDRGTWTQEGLDARKNLVERFYAYMTDPQGYGYQSWAQWVASKKGQIKEVIIHRTISSLGRDITK